MELRNRRKPATQPVVSQACGPPQPVDTAATSGTDAESTATEQDALSRPVGTAALSSEAALAAPSYSQTRNKRGNEKPDRPAQSADSHETEEGEVVDRPAGPIRDIASHRGEPQVVGMPPIPSTALSATHKPSPSAIPSKPSSPVHLDRRRTSLVLLGVLGLLGLALCAACYFYKNTTDPAISKSQRHAPTSACEWVQEPFLRSLLPSDVAWDEKAELLHRALMTPRQERKAVNALFVCSSSSQCRSSLASLGRRMQCLAGCTLDVDGMLFTAGTKEASGRLQSELSNFLRRCPRGVVMLDSLESVGGGALKVLVSALSEDGGLQLHGQNVPTTGAKFLLAAALPTAADRGPKQFDSDARRNLSSALESSATDVVGHSIQAFRGRINYIVPLRDQ